MATEYINLVRREIVDYALGLCEEQGLRYELKYRSKYNSYVVYDYEPFCMDTFESMLYMSGEREKIGFVTHLITQQLNKIDFLERCLITNPVIKKGIFCR